MSIHPSCLLRLACSLPKHIQPLLLWTKLILCILLRATIYVSAEANTYANSGRELALALASPSITNIVVNTSFRLLESDWYGLGDPVLVNRDVLIASPLELQEAKNYPAIDGAYVKRKVRLAGGVTMTMEGVVLTKYREDQPSLTPGIDLLASTDSSSNPAFLILHKVVINNPYCFPTNLSLQSVAASPRPAFWPGRNNISVNLPQPGCVNDTSAPWLKRCWAAHRIYYDVGTMATAFGVAERPEPQNYYIRGLDTDLLCDDVMTHECIAQYGPQGCYYIRFPRVKLPPSPGASPVPFLGDISFGPPVAPPEARSNTMVAVVAGVVCGAVGGGAVVLAVLVVLLARRGWCPPAEFAYRARAKSGPSEDAKEPPSNLSSAQPPPRGAAGQTAAAGLKFPFFSSSGVETPGHLITAAATAEGLPTGEPPRLQSAIATGSAAAVAPAAATVAGTAGGTEAGTFQETEKRSSELEDGPTSNPRTTPEEAFPDPAMPVTALTPPRADMKLLDRGTGTHDEVQLLPGRACGRGTYGRVLQGMYKGSRVAVKLVADAHMWGGAAEALVRTFAQEVEVLGRCCHPNVVRLLAACLTPPRLCLVMELMETSLERVLYARAPGNVLPLNTVLHIALEITKGLEYLHPTIIHRDLKPANVLLNDPWGARPAVKITDFGLSRIRSTVMPTRTPHAGTPAYLAPEGFDVSNNIITHHMDLYSLAVLIWEMVSGQRPWEGCSIVEIAIKVTVNGLRLPLDHLPEARCPPKLRSLLWQCWEADPRRRPAAAEVAKELMVMLQELEAAGSTSCSSACAHSSWGTSQQRSASPLPAAAADDLACGARVLMGQAAAHGPTVNSTFAAAVASMEGRITPECFPSIPLAAVCATTALRTVAGGDARAGGAAAMGFAGAVAVRAGAAGRGMHVAPAAFDPKTCGNAGNAGAANAARLDVGPADTGDGAAACGNGTSPALFYGAHDQRMSFITDSDSAATVCPSGGLLLQSSLNNTISQANPTTAGASAAVAPAAAAKR